MTNREILKTLPPPIYNRLVVREDTRYIDTDMRGSEGNGFTDAIIWGTRCDLAAPSFIEQILHLCSNYEICKNELI